MKRPATTIVLSLLLLALGYWPQAGSVPAAASGVPYDSVRKGSAITAADSARALERLAKDLQALINLPAEVKGGKVGIMVRSLSQNRTVYTMNPDVPLTPASTTKVVTAFTALSELKPDYQIKTLIAAAARPRDGVVEGDLFVKGFGDPYLTVSNVDDLAARAVNSGLTRVNGNVVGDGSFFDNKFVRTEYSGDEDLVEPLPPIAALTIERNHFTVIVSAPRTPGAQVNVQTFPRSSGFQIINTAVTTGPAPKKKSPTVTPIKKAPAKKKGARSELRLFDRYGTPLEDYDDLPRYGDQPVMPVDRELEQRKRGSKVTSTAKKGTARGASPSRAVNISKGSSATQTATKGGLKISVTGTRDGQTTITVSGTMLTNRTASYHYEMKNPALVVAGMVYDRLVESGVAVAGRPVTGAAPAKVRVVAETSRPLMEVMSTMMKQSNNYLAEIIFKMIGGNAGARDETAAMSVQRISQRMSLNRIDFNKCIINDGSGLSRANCLSAEALEGILEAAYRDKKLFPAFYSTMSIAGVDGTLRKRMKGTLAEGNVHGKTGTLRNVSALAGYVTTRDGDMFAFALLMNGGNHGAYRAVQDKIAQRLATFSYGESAAAK